MRVLLHLLCIAAVHRGEMQQWTQSSMCKFVTKPRRWLKPVCLRQVGKLELPLALLQTSTFMSPYISVWSITADGTGAGVMKARNTLLRNRLTPKQ